jgi:hypothetical protein
VIIISNLTLDSCTPTSHAQLFGVDPNLNICLLKKDSLMKCAGDIRILMDIANLGSGLSLKKKKKNPNNIFQKFKENESFYIILYHKFCFVSLRLNYFVK